MGNVELIEIEKCTGCGMCANLCPQNAIMMEENDEFFIIPKVNKETCNNCGLCLSKCPSIDYVANNNRNPIPYSVRGNDEVRRGSSSGGVFYLLAQKFIEEKGYVCGAVFDENLKLHHIVSNSIADVEKMRGSKYFQSNTEKIYKEIRILLAKGESVLFSGTPCQVAALYSFLGDEYSNSHLFTIDILCHGVPSQYCFDKYISENHNKPIENVNFRDKRYGWRADSITVEYCDGERYRGDMKEDLLIPKDTFELGFQHNIMLRKSCSNCKYCDFPRCGDITLGDFWGISKIDATQSDNKGTSLVYLNNERGEKLFNEIASDITIKEQKVLNSSIENRLKPFYPSHVHRTRFFDMLKRGYSFNNSVNYVYKKKYDVGIVGIYSVENFGGALTYYALYNTVNDMGLTTLLIERPNSAEHKPGNMNIYSTDPYPNYAKAKIYNTKEEMMELNNYCDTFLVGSDQMFNNYLYRVFGKWVTLDWVDDSKRKVAYAASFGHDYIWHPESTRAEMAYFMKKFDAFSVREESGVEICDTYFQTKARWVLDPVFLCKKEYYDKLIDQSVMEFPHKYIGCYILDLNQEKQRIICEVDKELGIPNIIFSEMNYKDLPMNGWNLDICDSNLVNDRLKCIAKSDFFIADSFHGICFAIIYKKNFICILNRKRGTSRFTTILGKLGLLDRIVECVDDLKNNTNIYMPIDYGKVYDVLEQEKLESINWLRDSLFVKKKKAYSDYHYIKEYADRQSREIKMLKNQNLNLSKRLERLYNSFVEYVSEDSGVWKTHMVDTLILSEECNIYEYLKLIKERKFSYLIVLTVCDNIGCRMNPEIAALLNDIGFVLDWCGIEKRTSYIAILNNGHLVWEQHNYEKETMCNVEVDGLKIIAESKLYRLGNATHININANDYAINKRGLNIVVYDKTYKSVIDSVCFDTHVDEYICYR